MVSEFFEYSINTILYQRGVYPIEDFQAYVHLCYLLLWNPLTDAALE